MINRFIHVNFFSVVLALALSACGGSGDHSEPSGQQPMFKGELTSEQVTQVLKKGAEINTHELQAEDAATSTGVMQAQRAMPKAGSRVTVFRFYNTQTSAHFYTTSETERANVIANLKQFSYEGPAFYGNGASGNGLSPVYRFFNTQTGVHFYTISEDEKAHIELNLKQFNYEGIAYYASKTSGDGLVGLFRFYVPSKGFHFYTANTGERDNIRASNTNYSYEGLGYYVFGSAVEALPTNTLTGAVREGLVAVSRDGTVGTNKVEEAVGGGLTLTTSDPAVANSQVGRIVHVPAATGGLAFPFTGRVTGVSTVSGKQQIRLIPANPEDVFEKLAWDIDTTRGGAKVAGVIAPKNASATFSFNQGPVAMGAATSARKLAVEGGLTAVNSRLNGTVTITHPFTYKGATITLKATANVSEMAFRSKADFDVTKFFNTGGWGQVSAVVSGKVGGNVSLEGAVADIKLAEMLTSTDVWDQLSWQGKDSFTLEGLDAQDKTGRIPLGGVILTTGAATAFTGNIPDSAVTFLSAAPTAVLWIYLNLDGTLSLQGETGWRAADYGFEQGYEFNLVGTVLVPRLINNSTPGWQELFANGNATYTQRVGLMPAGDVLLAGIRPAHVNAFVGAEFNGSMDGVGEYRFVPTPRTGNGAFCMQSHVWAGIELNTRFRVKAELTVFNKKVVDGLVEEQFTNKPVTWADEDLPALCVTGGAFSISATARGPDPSNGANGLVDINFSPAYNNTSVRSLTDIWRVTASCPGCSNLVFDIPASKAGLDSISLPLGKSYILTLVAMSNTYQAIKSASTSVTLVSAPNASFTVAANAGNCASLTLNATATVSGGRTIAGYAWQVQRSGAVVQSYSGKTVSNVNLPSCGTTQIHLTVSDSVGYTTVVSQTVDSASLGARVTDVSPTSAVLDQPTAFTVTGVNLPLTTQMVLGTFAECLMPTNRTSTGFLQTCTPRGTAGNKILTIMTNSIANGGVVIDSSRSLSVSNAPSSKYILVGNYSREECINDITTGLMWEGKTASGLRAGSNRYTNFDTAYFGSQVQMTATTNSYGYASYVNSIALCGYTNWRLPTKEELQSLIDGSRTPLKIDSAWFPNTGNYYWSSSPYVGNVGSAGYLRFDNGIAYNGFRTDPNSVRLVRASQ